MPQIWRNKNIIYYFSFVSPSCSCFLKIPSCSALATHQPLTHHALKCSLSSFSSFLKSCFFCENFLHHFSPIWWLQTFSDLNYCSLCIVSIWVRLLGPYPKGLQRLLCPSAHKHSKGNYKILIRRTQQGSSWGAAYKMSWGRCRSCWSWGLSALKVQALFWWSLDQRMKAKAVLQTSLQELFTTWQQTYRKSLAAAGWISCDSSIESMGEMLRPFKALEIWICLNCLRA